MAAIEVPDWHRVITLVGEDEGGDPHIIMVDTDGNLVAVIKGDYGGTLTTLATDADGHLLVVPYDPNDIWGNTVGMGLAELASILTSCKRYDRRGNVIFWDSFEDGVSTWHLAPFGTGSDAYLSAQRARYGAYSVKLIGGSDGDRLAGMERYFPLPVTGKIGFEAHVAIAADVESVGLYTFYRTGTTQYFARVRWVLSTEDYEYFDSAGAWQDIDATKSLQVDDAAFHAFKFVVDTSSWEYVRAFLDDEEYSLAGVGLNSAVAALPPALFVQVILYSDAAANGCAYVDDIILTQNEPAN